MDYTPHIDDIITLNLPDERTPAKLVRLVSKTHGIAELMSFTTNFKSHPYKKGDLVPCRFGKTGMGLTGWTVIGQEELDAAAKPDEAPAPKPSPARPMVDADIFGPAERKAGKKGKSDAAHAG